MGVVDGETAHGVAARVGVDDGLRGDAACFQRHGNGDGFHRRARFEGIGQRPVAQLLAAQVLPVVGVVGRVVGQRQHLARVHVHDHHAACLGFVGFNRLTQLLVGEKLNLAVNRQLQVGSVDRRDGIAHILDHPPQAVLDDAARPGCARQALVESELHTFLAHILHIGEAHNVRRRFTLRILSLVVFAQVYALDTQLCHLFGHRLVHLAFDPHEGFVFIGQALSQISRLDAQQTRNLVEVRVILVHILRNGPDALRGHAGSQNHAVAIQHTATVGRQLQCAGETHFALTLEKVVAHHLHIGRTATQPQERQAEAGHNELAAPNRRFAGQQRAGMVGNAAAHRITPDASAGEACGALPLSPSARPMPDSALVAAPTGRAPE